MPQSFSENISASDNISTLTVGLGERSYPIHIGHDCLTGLSDCLEKYSQIFVLCDDNIEQFCATQIEHFEALGAKIIVIEAGEQSKNFTTYHKLCETLLADGLDRQSLLIAFGGGVVGDLTGFLAATLMRGVDFIQIPTSLLAMVDSSVGGKTGINLDIGKNLVGAFYQPQSVWIDPAFLDSLPAREWHAGYAEIVKYGLIHDSAFFDFLEQNKLSDDALNHAILRSCQIKAEIVAMDETEKSGQRALLNFGHTFGHALERYFGYDGRLIHGEAVSIGMCLATEFSVQQGYISTSAQERIINHLKARNLPISLSDLGLKAPPTTDIVNAMYKDKKNSAGAIHLVLLKQLGQAQLVKSVDPAIISAFLDDRL